jgi:RNA polymerase sigma factor (sigma-70 family)
LTLPSSHPIVQAAARLIANYGWELVTAWELGQAAAVRLQTANPTPREINVACLTAYSARLYQACSEPGEAREKAYTDLYRYLMRLALKSGPPEMAEDAAQEALSRLPVRLAYCRGPETFLSFAAFELLHALDRLRPPKGEQPPEDMPDIVDGAPTPEQEAVTAAEAGAVLECLRRLAQSNPRASKQLAAVLMKYYDGLDDREIAEQLGTTVAHVHVLRSRGLAKLRPCLQEVQK